ncbi:MAG: hypothetical protein J6A00_13650 [Bacteroides sp.]|jgi:hypothetical protein|uniref:Uncharacterized protein n=1 Tax=Phocaeicola sartorii TaxID=671267 RepID=A0A4V3RU39_9BACT|nr:hypothetical protein [Phocaeicola sartorii]MBO5508771.1 hypothetical protein [Bacteroides sp.]TGY73389.1 hypothetical protein E5339_00140 [Phocaeicola sartorii]
MLRFFLLNEEEGGLLYRCSCPKYTFVDIMGTHYNPAGLRLAEDTCQSDNGNPFALDDVS